MCARLELKETAPADRRVRCGTWLALGRCDWDWRAGRWRCARLWGLGRSALKHCRTRRLRRRQLLAHSLARRGILMFPGKTFRREFFTIKKTFGFFRCNWRRDTTGFRRLRWREERRG